MSSAEQTQSNADSARQGQKRIVIGDAGGNAWRGDWRDAADDCETGMADLKDLDEVVVAVGGKDVYLNPAHITSIQWETRPTFAKLDNAGGSWPFSRYLDDPRRVTFHRAVIDACVEKDDLPKFSTRLAIVDAVLALIDSEEEAKNPPLTDEYREAVAQFPSAKEPKPDVSQKVAEGLAPWIRGFRGES